MDPLFALGGKALKVLSQPADSKSRKGVCHYGESARDRFQLVDNRASELIERSTTAVRKGADLAEHLAHSLAVIDGKAQQVDGIVEQIARASSEQSQAISALTQAISDLSSTALKSVGGGQTADLVRISQD